MEKRTVLKQFSKKDVVETVDALRSVRSAWLRDPAVVAVDVGYRLENGKPKEPSKCSVWYGTDGERLCKEERDAIEARGEKLPEPENYDLPWIRVHVDRRLTPQQVETLGRCAYHRGLSGQGDGKRYEVNVVEALYQPLAEASGAVTLEALAAMVLEEHPDLAEKMGGVERVGKDGNGYVPDYLEGGAAVEARDRVEPLTGGVSIGDTSCSCGTLGTIVWDRTDCTPCILSNWHVLSGSGVAKGARCMQPSLADGGIPSRDTVAHLKRSRLNCRMDAALAELNGSREYAVGTILSCPEGRGATMIQGVDTKELHGLLGQPVWKCARTSEVTQGLIDGVAMSLCVTYADGTTQIFHDQLHIIRDPRVEDDREDDREVAQAGDSGAVWLNQDHEAVGLQFAGDTTNSPLGDFAVANLMRCVAEELRFSLNPVFLHPRTMEERRRETELRAEIAKLKPPAIAHETARELVDVVSKILERVIERFDEVDVSQAMGEIRSALGPGGRPESRPPGG